MIRTNKNGEFQVIRTFDRNSLILKQFQEPMQEDSSHGKTNEGIVMIGWALESFLYFPLDFLHVLLVLVADIFCSWPWPRFSFNHVKHFVIEDELFGSDEWSFKEDELKLIFECSDEGSHLSFHELSIGAISMKAAYF